MTQPKLIIHGGLGSRTAYERKAEILRPALKRIAEESYTYLQNHSALETVVFAASLLEDDPLFNAGTGAKIQSDGVIRLTASVMFEGRFAGVMNIREVRNPVQIAALLLKEQDRVLAGDQALAFARSRGFGSWNCETPDRREEYERGLKGKTGTIGCVALDAQGRLAAATSTGGKGNEIPGRVSDSSTVAGNYANTHAAVSCTGTGEEIVEAALAAKIVTRVSDGMALEAACEKSVAELKAADADAGFIALDVQGNMRWGATSPYLSYAMHDGTVRVF